MSDALREGLSSLIAALMSACILYACAVALRGYIKAFRAAVRGEGGRDEARAAPHVRGMLACAAAALLSRLLLYAVSYLFALSGDIEPQLSQMWVRWDASNYLYIAEHGYAAAGEQAYYIVFFPLYPFIVRCFMFVTRDAFAASLIVSNLCYCGAAALLYRYMEARAGRKAGAYAVAWMLAWPASFFCAAPMTEALFLLLCVACLLAVDRKAYIVAGVMGLLCALTRSPGVLLALPLAAGAALDIAAAPRAKRAVIAARAVMGLALVSAGLVIYCYINYGVTGDPFRFLLYQREHWNQRMGFFFETIRMTASYMFMLDGNTPYIWIPQLLSMAACTAVLCLSVKKMEPVVGLYFCALFVISISPTWLLSGARYIMGIAPMYMALGALTGARPARYLPALGASGALLLIYLAPYIWFMTVM